MTNSTVKQQPYPDSAGKNSHKRKTPHLRLTTEEIKARRDCMRCDQYLADLLASMKAIGWKFIIHDIPKFAEQIGLSMRTFQRARRMLIDTGKLVENRINRDSLEFFLVAENDQIDAQDDTAIAENDPTIALDDPTIVVIPLKAAPQAEISDSSDLLSSSYSNPLSVPPPTQSAQSERENFEILKNGKPVPAFKDWLYQQAIKMPRTIANIPVWIAAMSKRPEWQETFIEWLEQCRETEYSAAPLSPSTDYLIAPERSAEELAILKESIAKAKESLRGAS